MISLPRDARHERRVQVSRLRKAGHTYAAIVAQTGLSRTGVSNICQRHANSGAKALRDAMGGRKVGEFLVLTADQERQVQQLIRDQTPDQAKLSYALWSRVAVSELMAERFGLRSDDVRGRSFGPQRRAPVIRVGRQRAGLSIISTATHKGQMRWKIFDGALNSAS